jgi:hypothetical protein
MDRLAASLVAAPLVFAVAVFFTRAPVRRLAGAFAGGVAFAAGNVCWDLLALHAGWWHYPGFGVHAPLMWYAAAGLAAAGITLVGWRAIRRFGRRGLLVFLVAFTVFCPIRDYGVAQSAEPTIAFSPGPLPWFADAAAGLSLMALATLIQLALGGDVQSLRSSAWKTRVRI